MTTISGRFVISAVNVSDAVAEIATLVKASVPKTVALRLDLDGDVPPVEADPSQIQQLVMNLIINAAEAIDDFWSPPRVTAEYDLRVATRRQRVAHGSQLAVQFGEVVDLAIEHNCIACDGVNHRLRAGLG